MNIKFKSIFILLFIYAGCTDNANEKKIKKGEFLLVGNFINDSIPDGTIKFYDRRGKLNSIKNYKYGLLNGETVNYYSNGIIESRVDYKDDRKNGTYLIYDSLGHLIYKSNFYYGKEIGSVFSYDTSNNVIEYSFNNFEDDILYYYSYDPSTKKTSYPDTKFLIKAGSTGVANNGKDGVKVFVYIFNPPHLKLSYKICYLDQNDKVVSSFDIPHDSFFYEKFCEKQNNDLRIGILLNKYDSLSKKEEVLVKYLKTSYNK